MQKNMKISNNGEWFIVLPFFEQEISLLGYIVYEKETDSFITIFLRPKQFMFYKVVKYNILKHKLLFMD